MDVNVLQWDKNNKKQNNGRVFKWFQTALILFLEMLLPECQQHYEQTRIQGSPVWSLEVTVGVAAHL